MYLGQHARRGRVLAFYLSSTLVDMREHAIAA